MTMRFGPIVILMASVNACATVSPPAWVPAAETAAGPPLIEGLSEARHAINTTVPLAQRYFDQGLALAWSARRAEAEASFREAARLDPHCAICWWGVALSLGPHVDGGPVDERGAFDALERAVELSDRASDAERAYIFALTRRHAPQPVADRAALDLAYAEAMRGVASAWPDDADAAALLAEALLVAQGTTSADAAKMLEHVLAASPGHPGAVHLSMHALGQCPASVPAAAHLRELAARICP
jgi:tetratricopeptide (TPR) repeat protein